MGNLPGSEKKERVLLLLSLALPRRDEVQNGIGICIRDGVSSVVHAGDLAEVVGTAPRVLKTSNVLIVGLAAAGLSRGAQIYPVQRASSANYIPAR
jgi:hypothetical protein